MFSLVAFSKSHDPGGTYANLTACTDQHIKTQGNFATVPKKMPLLIGAAALVGALGARARLISPSIREKNPMMVSPTIELLVPPATHPEWLKPANAFPLESDENLSVEEDSNPAAAEQHTCIVALADQIPSPVAGPMVSIRATITLAQLAGAWNLSELTLIDDLPVANYAVIGARLNAAGAVAFRFVPIGASHRPGGLACQDEDDIEIWYQRNGGLGVWLTFDTTQLPSVEVLGSAAAGSATYDMIIDIVPA